MNEEGERWVMDQIEEKKQIGVGEEGEKKG